MIMQSLRSKTNDPNIPDASMDVQWDFDEMIQQIEKFHSGKKKILECILNWPSAVTNNIIILYWKVVFEFEI